MGYGSIYIACRSCPGAFLLYGGLWFVSKGRWIGFGDAKLAIPLGFILGAPAVFTFVVFSFWIGGYCECGNHSDSSRISGG